MRNFLLDGGLSQRNILTFKILQQQKTFRIVLYGILLTGDCRKETSFHSKSYEKTFRIVHYEIRFTGDCLKDTSQHSKSYEKAFRIVHMKYCLLGLSQRNIFSFKII